MHHLTVLLLALLLDYLFGDPKRLRPWVGFQMLAQYLEGKVNLYNAPPVFKRTAGAIVVISMLAFAYLTSLAVAAVPVVGYVGEVILLYLALGNRTLLDRTRAVISALDQNNLDEARLRTAQLDRRQTDELTELGVTRATVESVLECGNDVVFGSIFWFLLCGAPGAVAYRLINILHAMWRDKDDAHFADFGWAAAFLHNLLNYVPSRITGLTYALSGNFSSGWACWRDQAREWYNPNDGILMAAGAGSLGVELGGPAMYQGKVDEGRPLLGKGDPPKPSDIERSISLLQRSLAMWLLISVVICLAMWR
jgi:adenosylcobinamide-phosphate synthase